MTFPKKNFIKISLILIYLVWLTFLVRHTGSIISNSEIRPSDLKSAGLETPAYQILFKSVQFLHFWSFILNPPLSLKDFEIWISNSNSRSQKPLSTKNNKVLIGGNNSGLKGLSKNLFNWIIIKLFNWSNEILIGFWLYHTYFIFEGKLSRKGSI